jgi:Na+/H+-dicarboxylate symporter
MGGEAKRCDGRMIPALMVALLMGVGLHDLFQLWPSIITEFIAPVNESIWEHVKIVLFPLLLVEFLFYPKTHRTNGLTAILLVCGGMLVLAWLYHVAWGGRLFVVDLVLFAGTILLYFVLSSCLNVPESWRSILTGVYIIVIGLVLAFTITPPHGTLFNDPALADAWVNLTC